MAHLAAGNALFGDLKSSQPFFLMAGPNVIQSEEHIFAMCRELKRVTDELDVPFIFKSSFDKANRTSITSFRGPGIDDGLRILQAVKTTFDVPIVTDIHTEEQAEPVSAVADVMQIPAFLCRQTDLLLAAGRTGRVINIKKGQFCAPSVMRNSAKKVFSTGNENVLLCERGSTFGYSDLVCGGRHEKYSIDARRRLPDRRRRYALAPTTSGLGGRGWRGGFGRLARAHPNHRSIVRRGWCGWTFYGGSQ